MGDYIARKRLKKKMLDRWENEGGKVSSEQTTADRDGPTNDDQREGKQVSASDDKSTGGRPASPTKTKKRTRK